MLAGGIAAFVAWAILEPYYNDNEYYQGVVKEISSSERLTQRFIQFLPEDPFSFPLSNVITVGDEKIHFQEETKVINPDGSVIPFSYADLKPGKEIGVYVEYYGEGSEGFSFAVFVNLDPPEQSPDKEILSISQMAARTTAAGLILFSVVAGCVGLAIGAIDGIVCRQLKRAFIGGIAGLLIGFIAAFFSAILAGMVYSPLSDLASRQFQDAGSGSKYTPFGLFIQITGRGLAWCLAGMVMGLGPGIARQSKRMLLYGFLGGLIGGLLFDPIDLLTGGFENPSAHISRMIGLTVIGLTIGLMIGVVELLARDTWLQMVKGPLAGKEFMIFKDLMRVGAAPRNDLYLFNDEGVADNHAIIRTSGDICEIQNLEQNRPLLINGHPVRNARLRNGDNITLGQTEFVFQSRRG